MKEKAFIFDFDGTLVDSEKVHAKSWKDLLHVEFGLEFEEHDYFQYFAGIPSMEIAIKAKEKYALITSVAEIVERIEAISDKNISETNITFMPHAKEALDFLRTRNIPMSIVTGSSQEEAEPILEKLKVIDYFDYIITSDDVEHSKPNPEGYKRCVQLMGYKTNEYLVFEDTAAGVSAAKGASLQCFGIQRVEQYRSKLLEAGADAVFSNLQEAIHHSFGISS